MPLYDGVVTLNQDQLPVIIGVEDDSLRMSSGGTEIGEWPKGEYSISDEGDGVYTITAEDERMQFVPNNPTLFAVGLNGGAAPVTAPDVPTPGEPEHAAIADQDKSIDEAPPAKPVTRLLFYVLSGVTAALGLWAMVSLVMG